MKKSLVAIAALAMIIATACSDKDSGPKQTAGDTLTLKGNIDTSMTLKAGQTYFLEGLTFFRKNAVLTIEPGVVVKARKGTKATLIITRGSKIMAEGTAAKPIVFTSAEAAGARNYSDWGGVVLLGKAPVNTAFLGTANSRQMEGLTQADLEAYAQDVVGGGDIPTDNSGILKYVRIEFAGISLSTQSNSELNSLTMVGVGSGTVIDYVQCSFGGDDAFEWFGGTVNAKHLISYRTLDDDFDTDNGYNGKVQFGLAIRDKDISDKALPGQSNGFESDNDIDGSDNPPYTSPVFSNMTIVGPWAINNGENIGSNVFQWGVFVRRASRMNLYNSIVVGWPYGVLFNGVKSAAAAIDGNLAMKNNIITGSTIANVSTAGGITADFRGWFANAANANDTTTTLANLKLAKLSGVNATTMADLDARPIAGSPALTKAAFTDAKVADAYFNKVQYVGALNVGDTWTTGWTNFDPKSAAY
ncbi:hypothetical protein MKQ68_24515 [Chitinophaga horti]|uniref:T9SS C-terminal target domain-containing protein n=1 Tax=Chitinophaga horti TaxID=2920382 RepID=A0ABY6J4L5_9BACT|nr:hypothetical protein [Chitinophaga horti]UYQ93251.1 hypothetical protein MKQ68_24515 [Chitinophaga horti]